MQKLTPSIRVAELRKSFDAQVALDGISFQVPRGSVLALIGPNGSGKTTTVRILSTLLRPDAGAAAVEGHDVVAEPELVRSAIGVTGQFSAVDGLLTARENLALIADLRHLGRFEGRSRVSKLVDQFELNDTADKPAAALSGGMRRRLDLAMTLVGDPRIIFLDEPTAGLDPRSRRVMWNVVRDLVAAGVTILLTTQYLEEADELADEVVVLDHGRVVAHGTPAELKNRVPGGYIRLEFADAHAILEVARILDQKPPAVDDLMLHLATDGSVKAVQDVLDRLGDRSGDVRSLTVQAPSLDNAFFALTGHADTPEVTR